MRAEVAAALVHWGGNCGCLVPAETAKRPRHDFTMHHLGRWAFRKAEIMYGMYPLVVDSR